VWSWVATRYVATSLTWVISRRLHARSYVGDEAGNVMLLSPALDVAAQLSVCHKRINTVRFIDQANLATFACQDGLVGVLRFDRAARTLVLLSSFSTQGAALAATPDPSGHWIVAYSESNIAYVYDIARRMVHPYEGQAARISYASAPTPDFNRIVVGDVNGTMRVWALPPTASRMILEAPRAIFNVAFASDNTLITDGFDGIVRRIDIADGRVNELRGHSGMVNRVMVSPGGDTIASVGSDQTVRTWQTSDGGSLRTFTEHAAEINDADYLERGHQIASAGTDGRLFVWPITGTDATLLFKRPIPLVALEVLRHNDHVVVADAAGGVWEVASNAPAPDVGRPVRVADGATVTLLRASPDGHLLAVGTDLGSVTVYDTSDWTVAFATSVGGAVRQIAFDPKARDLVIASEDGSVRVAALDARRALPWGDVPAAVRDVAYAPDGETIAFVCADGGAWFYAVHGDAWVYARDHFADTVTGTFSPDGKWFASCDRKGIVTLRDVAATFAATLAPANSSNSSNQVNP
jgi:WD40 repeat protein